MIELKTDIELFEPNDWEELLIEVKKHPWPEFVVINGISLWQLRSKEPDNEPMINVIKEQVSNFDAEVWSWKN